MQTKMARYRVTSRRDLAMSAPCGQLGKMLRSHCTYAGITPIPEH